MRTDVPIQVDPNQLIIYPGYTFCPTDEDVLHYLKQKAYGIPVLIDFILDQNVYEVPPWQLRRDVLYPVGEDQSIYYYSLVKRSGVTYSRLKRTVGDHGHWHMNGKRTDIFDDQGNVIGYKTALKFHQADGSSKGLPSEWLMTEFRLNYDNDGDSCKSQGL
ncbi:NAC domain-containing protein 101-like [Dioscorea cayenensis subsp. rotundata]|uniref:NAC domain-containing protein 101-like n=1 Tax=Dioscorea cayennensis subsp. rotundata TaxID=55577 RepID=A0AB40CVR9_DIOCR|nr:NAC domain-containing protein 101-like [Dioscorea cayenensis subsp. rotundata]